MYYIIYFIANFAFISQVLGAAGGRSVNGLDATILQHPHIVSIEFLGEHMCGGSLIKPNIVLTAAHCLFSNDSAADDITLLTVRSGTATKETGGQTAKVIAVCVNPNYKKNISALLDYDEGLIKLDRSLSLDSSTQLIELQPKGVDVPDGSIGSLVGWGALQERLKNKPYPSILQEIKVHKINHEICQVSSALPVTDRHICFSSYGLESVSFCSGDSGGPIVVDGAQVGIVSASVGCALPLFFTDLYISVGNVEIRDHIDECILKFEK